MRIFPKFLGIPLFALVTLVACSQTDDGGQTPRPSEYATVTEAVEGLNTFMADAVSIASGFTSNELLRKAIAVPCLACTGPTIQGSGFPVVLWVFYDTSVGEDLGDGRLPTGTWSFDPVAYEWTRQDSPTDALVIAWNDQESGDDVHVRLDWKKVSPASSYTQYGAVPSPFWPFESGPDLPSIVGVPVHFEVRVSVAAKDVLFLDVKQALKDTSCGTLAEATKLTATGYLSSGAQRVDLHDLTFDRTREDRFSVNLDATVKSGSMSLPISAEYVNNLGKTTRDVGTCEVVAIEDITEGTISVGAGAVDEGVRLAGTWSLEDEGSASAPKLSLSDTVILVGNKRIDVSGILDLSVTTESLASMLLTFADQTMHLADFQELLTYPSLP